MRHAETRRASFRAAALKADGFLAATGRHAEWEALKTAMLSVFVMIVAALGGNATDQEFPRELVEFVPYDHNPIFASGGKGQWDESIRERGWILHEDGGYHLWYTGYAGPYSSVSKLGYATSPD